jgi:hypothetical protein
MIPRPLFCHCRDYCCSCNARYEAPETADESEPEDDDNDNAQE